jgi:hypothetical protein
MYPQNQKRRDRDAMGRKEGGDAAVSAHQKGARRSEEAPGARVAERKDGAGKCCLSGCVGLAVSCRGCRADDRSPTPGRR